MKRFGIAPAGLLTSQTEQLPFFDIYSPATTISRGADGDADAASVGVLQRKKLSLTFLGDSHAHNGIFEETMHRILQKQGSVSGTHKVHASPCQDVNYLIDQIKTGCNVRKVGRPYRRRCTQHKHQVPSRVRRDECRRPIVVGYPEKRKLERKRELEFSNQTQSTHRAIYERRRNSTKSATAL